MLDGLRGLFIRWIDGVRVQIRLPSNESAEQSAGGGADVGTGASVDTVACVVGGTSVGIGACVDCGTSVGVAVAVASPPQAAKANNATRAVANARYLDLCASLIIFLNPFL